MTITYSNPRMHAVIENWPSGSMRTTATFAIETHPTRGQRATRFTLRPKTGKPSATKVLTYASKVRIVDGDDGKTYILELSDNYGFITVMQGGMQFEHETIWPRHDGERFAAVMKLFEEPVS